MDIPDDLADAVREAGRIAVLTGAGVSAESGVPTFRDARTGLWARYEPEELATPEAFARDPALVWNWYAWRRGLVAGVSPNPGHEALAEMERRTRDFTLITQNVDGLHQRAGSQRVIEIHGSLTRTSCSVERTIVESWPEGGPVPPRCPECGAPLRPDVVWFGESLPAAALEQAMGVSTACDVFLCVGTSALVQPAASLPMMALESGARVVEINPEPTPLSPSVHHLLRGPSGEVLPAVLERVWPPSG